jgi:hypothetical protein
MAKPPEATEDLWQEGYDAGVEDVTTGAGILRREMLAALRNLVTRWRSDVAPERVGEAPTGPMSGVVATSLRCASELERLIDNLTSKQPGPILEGKE